MHTFFLRIALIVLALLLGVFGGSREPSAEARKRAELLAVTETREAAETLAALYGVELIDWSEGLAKFHTNENPNDVIRRGEKNGWTPLSVNQRYELH